MDKGTWLKGKFSVIVYLYLFLPIFIFVFCWIKIYYSLFILVILSICLCKMIVKPDKYTSLCWSKNTIYQLIIGAIIILLSIIVSGIGGFAFQQADHIYRNGMFETMVNEKWPIIADFYISDGNVETRAFSYYFGFWIVPALVGKVFGLTWGYIAQVVWAFIGLYLVYYAICIILGKARFWYLLVFLTYGGTVQIGKWIFGSRYYAPPLLISSNWASLWWIFNQCIPAWLIILFIYIENSNKYRIIILSTALIYCTMPFVGMLPIVLVLVLQNFIKTNNRKIRKNEIFSFENIFGGGIIGILLFLFLRKTNVSNSSFVFFDFSNGGIAMYVSYMIISIGIIAIILFQDEKKNLLFWVSIIEFCILMLFPMDRIGNLSMRAIIPVQTLFSVYFIMSMQKSINNKNNIRFAILLSVIILNYESWSDSFVTGIKNTELCYWSDGKESYTKTDVALTSEIMHIDNETTTVDNNLFFKYFVKDTDHIRYEYSNIFE